MKLPNLSLLVASLTIGFLAFTSVGCALRDGSADKPTQKLEALFRQADTNGDGRVSREEFTAMMMEEAFQWMDANHNGRISEQEFLASGGTRAQFRSLDRGGKGYFTLEDAKANPAARQIMSLPFAGADVNGDGYVSWQEFLDYRARAAVYTN